MTPDRPVVHLSQESDNVIVFTQSADGSARPSLCFAHLPRESAPVRIRVVGIGGAGGNVLNCLADQHLPGVDTLALNTDRQALSAGRAAYQIVLGEALTRGRGAGGDPLVGRQAAEASAAMLREALQGVDLVFIAAGMGGGTGTGAAPVVARLARELGALCVALVTRPFGFEGRRRAQIAEQGIADLRASADTLIIVPNDRLLQAAARTTTVREAFGMADAVLHLGVQGLVEMITRRGLINVDFADVRAILEHAGLALLGIGLAHGRNRAVEAVRRAMACPLLEGRLEGARRLLLNVAGGDDLGLLEVNQAAEMVTRILDPQANIIFGATLDPALTGGPVKVTLIAADIRDAATQSPCRSTWPSSGVSIGAVESTSRSSAPSLPLSSNALDHPPFLRRIQRGTDEPHQSLPRRSPGESGV